MTNGLQAHIDRIEEYSRKLYARHLITSNTEYYKEHPDYIDPQTVNSRCDLLVTGTTETNAEMPQAVELKFRFFSSTFPKFTEEGYLIEFNKIKSLNSIYQRTGHVPYYVNFTTDRKVLTWNLAKIDWDNHPFTNERYQYATVSDSDDTTVKRVYYLTESEAEVRDLNMNDEQTKRLFDCIQAEIKQIKLLKYGK